MIWPSILLFLWPLAVSSFSVVNYEFPPSPLIFDVLFHPSDLVLSEIVSVHESVYIFFQLSLSMVSWHLLQIKGGSGMFWITNVWEWSIYMIIRSSSNRLFQMGRRLLCMILWICGRWVSSCLLLCMIFNGSPCEFSSQERFLLGLQFLCIFTNLSCSSISLLMKCITWVIANTKWVSIYMILSKSSDFVLPKVMM